MTDEVEVTTAAGKPAGTVPAVSPVLARVREQREKLAKSDTITLKVPGYDELLGGGAVVIRYKAVRGKEITLLAQRMEKSKDDNAAINTAADIIVRCCDAILVRQKDDADLEPLDPSADEPTTFSSATLGGLLDFEAGSAREEVFGLFSPDGVRDLAVVDQAGAVVNWLQGKVREIDQELLGE